MMTLPPPPGPHQHQPHFEDDFLPPRRPFWKRPGWWLLGVIVVAVGVFLFTRGPSNESATAHTTTPTLIGEKADYEPPSAPAAPPPRQPPPSNLKSGQSTPPAPPLDLGSFNTGNNGAAQNNRPAGQSGSVYYAATRAVSKPQAGGNGSEGEKAKSGIAYHTAQIPGMKASPQIDDTYQLDPGILPIELDTAISTENGKGGWFEAHTMGPVYSKKGVILMEKGTRVFGTYHGLEGQGISRLPLDTAYAMTPNNIFLSLEHGYGAGPLGQPGITGSIDNHYLERFGGAVLLDVGQAGLSIVQSEVAKGGNTYLNFNSSSGLAEQILASTINIKPTFTANQSKVMAIFLPYPSFFDDSYRISKQ